MISLEIQRVCPEGFSADRKENDVEVTFIGVLSLLVAGKEVFKL